MNKTYLLLLIPVCLLFSQTVSYEPQFQNKKNELSLEKSLVSASLVTFSVITIYQTGKPIYYNESRSKFRFTRRANGDLEIFDNGLRGLDKFGHIYSTSLFAQNIYFLSRWSGLNNKSASLTSFALASSIMGAMEIHDAYYKRWGFAIGDFIANLAGAAFIIGQQNYPFMRNIDYKMSYDFTKKAADEAVIESYPNMTFWLTANPAGLFEQHLPAWIPSWLNVAIGISTTHSRPHRRELIIALDYNLKRIKTKSVFVKHLIHLLDRYKLPAPGIRLAPGFIGYGLYF